MTAEDNYNYDYSFLTTDDEFNDDTEVIITQQSHSSCDGDNVSDYGSSDEPPKDRYRFVQITFILIGLSPLLPWNFFITPTDYWMYKFRNVNESYTQNGDKNNYLQKYFNSFLSISNNAPFLIILIINAFFGHKIRSELRNTVSFIGIIVIFIVNTIFVKIDSDKWQNTFFGITMTIVFVLSIFAAFLQGSTAGVASVFPTNCMHAMVTGQAIAGIVATIAQILSLMGNWDAQNSAFYFFLFADLTLILAFVMYILMLRTDYSNYYMGKLNFNRRRLESFPQSSDRSGNNIKTVFVSIWPHAVSVMMVFWVSLALYPPVTVLVQPKHPNSSQWTGKYFLPLSCFLLFNSGDFIGRTAGRFCPLPLTRQYLLLFLSLLRIILIPLIMLCNAHPRTHMPVLFESEAYYIIFMTLLGLSNGYVFTNAMIHGPKFAPENLKENAGFMLVAFLGLGLTLGAFTSIMLLKIM